MEFSPIWLHDHKTQHDNLIISIASIKFCSFQKFKSSVVTHQAWKNLNWIVPSYWTPWIPPQEIVVPWELSTFSKKMMAIKKQIPGSVLLRDNQEEKQSKIS